MNIDKYANSCYSIQEMKTDRPPISPAQQPENGAPSFSDQLHAAAEHINQHGYDMDDWADLQALSRQLRPMETVDAQGVHHTNYRGAGGKMVSRHSAESVIGAVEELGKVRVRNDAVGRVADFIRKPESEFAAGPDIKRATGLGYEDILRLGFGSYSEMKRAAQALNMQRDERAQIDAAQAAVQAHADKWNGERDKYRAAKEAASDRVERLSYAAKLSAGGEIGLKRNPDKAKEIRDEAIAQAEQEGHSVGALKPSEGIIFPENTPAQQRTSELVALLKAHDRAIAEAATRRRATEEAKSDSAVTPPADSSASPKPAIDDRGWKVINLPPPKGPFGPVLGNGERQPGPGHDETSWLLERARRRPGNLPERARDDRRAGAARNLGRVVAAGAGVAISAGLNPRRAWRNFRANSKVKQDARAAVLLPDHYPFPRQDWSHEGDVGVDIFDQWPPADNYEEDYYTRNF